MSFRLEFDTGNSAFSDPNEISRILKKVADQTAVRIAEEDDEYPIEGTILDINGAKVGSWTYGSENDDA